MRKAQLISMVIMAALLPVSSLSAQVPPPPRLVISQFRVTPNDGQFFTIFNTTDAPVDMSKVQLQYFNNYDLAKATTVKTISLAGSLGTRSYYQVNDGALQLCYQSVVNSASLGFSSTAGMVQITEVAQTATGQGVSQVLDDYVAWASATTKNIPAGVQALPTPSATAVVVRQPVDSANNPVIASPGSGTWKSANLKPDCSVAITSTVVIKPPVGKILPAGPAPPVMIKTVIAGAGGSIPALDIGLKSPQITELLPNTRKPQSDAEDEFIELYNPNKAPFDLSGFVLQTGLNTKHKYIFPAGTVLDARKYKAYKSSQTHLTLSNTASQATLLDPLGNELYKTAEYDSAKDGQAWILTPDAWRWSSQPTPGDPNVLTTDGSAGAAKISPAVKGASTVGGTSNSTGRRSAFFSQTPRAQNLHPAILVGVGMLALLYGLYEYRHDLANQIYRFRRYREARRSSGEAA